MPELADTLLMHQNKAELMFAGGVMLDPEYAVKTCGWLDPGAFRDERLGRYWRSITDGTDAAEAAVNAGIYFEIAHAMTQVTTQFDTPSFAQTISNDRFLVEAAHLLPDLAKAITGRDIVGLKSLARLIVDGSPDTGNTTNTADQIGAEFEEVLENIAGRSEKTGISTLDYATGGLELSSMSVLAARPSMGKSSFGIQVCKYKAEKENKITCLFSLEMSKINVWARMACGELRIAWRDVRAGRVDEKTIGQIKEKSRELRRRLGTNLIIDDRSGLSMDEIWRVVSSTNPQFVLIDHMGLVKPTSQDEVNSLGDISWMGKMIAKTYEIPVVFLYQLNRGTEYRDEKRPTLKDLRGSGKIEENADNVFFLYRPDYYETATGSPSDVSDAEIIVGKFRDGVRNIQIRLKYNLLEQTFYPVENRRD